MDKPFRSGSFTFCPSISITQEQFDRACDYAFSRNPPLPVSLVLRSAIQRCVTNHLSFCIQGLSVPVEVTPDD